jgi:hypothetical protein
MAVLVPYQVNVWRLASTTKAEIVQDVQASNPDDALCQAMRAQRYPYVHCAVIIPADCPRGTMQGWVWRYRCRLGPDGRLVGVM